MKNRRIVCLEIAAIVLLVLSLLAIAGCSSQKASTTSSSSIPTTSAPAAQTTASAAKTIKIGYIGWLESGMGIDTLHSIQIMNDKDNQNGGITVGGEKYKVEVISYDSQNSQSTATAAANKLVFQDNVKFIMSDAFVEGGWLSITEANKVVVSGMSFGREDLLPTNNYTFCATSLNGSMVAGIGWFCKNNPDLIKNVAIAVPDNQMGHMSEKSAGPIWQKFGATPTWLYFPADSQDFSSLGTKVKDLNPSVFSAQTGSPATEGVAMKAAYQSGWKGTLYSNSSDPRAILTIYGADKTGLEGFISQVIPWEFDPAVTPAAVEYKTAWLAKFGKYEGEGGFGAMYSGLTAAIQQANSVDPDKVMAVVANGMKFEDPSGTYQMVNRPDMGNDRTVDSVSTLYMQKVVNGKITLYATIPVEEAVSYAKAIWVK